jgi:hypothetical protein
VGETGPRTDLVPNPHASTSFRDLLDGKVVRRRFARVVPSGAVGRWRRFSTLGSRPSALQSGHQLLGLPGSHGPVAQLGERRPRMAEVRGSSPLGSTPFFPANTGKRDAPYIWNGGFVQQPCSNACPVRSDSQILSKESSGIPASRCLVLPHIKVVHVGGVQASPWDLFNQLLIIA